MVKPIKNKTIHFPEDKNYKNNCKHFNKYTLYY